MDSLQALLPRAATTSQAVLASVEGIRTHVSAPRIHTLTGGTDVIYDTRQTNNADRIAQGSIYVDAPTATRIDIINLDAAVVKVGINNLASANEYHDILAAATADKAGNGGRLTFLEKSYNHITVIGTAGKQISVVVHTTR